MADYEEDNAYLNNGLPFEPASRQRARDKEKAEVLQALPKLKEIVERLSDRIDFYKSVDSIPAEIMASPDEFMHVVAANKVVVQILDTERSLLEGLIDDYR